LPATFRLSFPQDDTKVADAERRQIYILPSRIVCAGAASSYKRRKHKGGSMRAVLQELERRRAEARLGGGEKRIAAQHGKGKLTARERIEVLLDEGSFEEVDMHVTPRAAE